jgi:chemotaxis signal transduction protein
MTEWTPYEIVAPQMRSLQKLDASLQRLDIRWEVIDTTARIVCPAQAVDFLHTLEKTRKAFGTLAQEMVDHMAKTHLHNRLNDLTARAQVAIDILVRNLFERTADVGFISTDMPLVSFVQHHAGLGEQVDDAPDAMVLRQRLHEYRAKYTVYDDILVLDAHAQPLLGLVERASDDAAHAPAVPPWWRQLMEQAGYVEHYGETDWFAGQGPQLLYAHRVMSSGGRPCGAVVLRFCLADELQSIFADLLAAGDRVIVGLVDAHGKVLASSQSAALAVSDHLAMAQGHSVADRVGASMVVHQGHDYLVARCNTRGYQGYRGLPWQAVAMVRLDCAFRGVASEAAATQANAVQDSEWVLNDPMLGEVVSRAQTIQEDLTRVIWNGKLAESAPTNGGSLNAVFDQIGRTGRDTIALFDHAIRDLRALLLAGHQTEIQAHARLAVNIMDRNLYERANDCRWWALSHELVSLLAALRGAQEAQALPAKQRAAAILAHLNSLYTVYRRVALFDREGKVVAVSRDADVLPDDLRLDADLLRQTLALKGSQAYAVSPMQPQVLADGNAAYVYCAALRAAPDQPALGGIALVFDCANELPAMLRDALPPDTSIVGFLTDPQGRVLATTSADTAVGERLDLVPALDTLAPGAAQVRWRGNDYLAGIAHSGGYREFKRTDNYQENVLSVLLMPVQSALQSSHAPAVPEFATGPGAASGPYGIVQCGTLLLAIESRHVQQALSAERLVHMPGAGYLAGMLEVQHAGKRTMAPAYDACRLVGQAPQADLRQSVAVVVDCHQRLVVLLVQKLHSVASFDKLYPVPAAIAASAPWITGILGDNRGGKALVYVMDPQGFDAKLMPLPPDGLPDPSASDHEGGMA